MKTGETHQLKVDTMENDTVEYQTNSYLAQYTHSDKETSCTRFNNTVATVDDSGLITANATGKTACIVTITHEDGTIERKQCIVEVKE